MSRLIADPHKVLHRWVGRVTINILKFSRSRSNMLQLRGGSRFTVRLLRSVMLQLGGGSRFTVSSRELKWGGIYIYFISVLCTITAESSTTDLATTHLTSLARDIFWSQKSQLYIVNSYSWEFFFRLANIFQTR